MAVRVTPDALDVPVGVPSGSHQLWPCVPPALCASSPTDQVTAGVPGAWCQEMTANSQSPAKFVTGTGRERVPGSGMPAAVSGNANDADPATVTVMTAEPAAGVPGGAASAIAAAGRATDAPAERDPAGAATASATAATTAATSAGTLIGG